MVFILALAVKEVFLHMHGCTWYLFDIIKHTNLTAIDFALFCSTFFVFLITLALAAVLGF